MTDHLLSLVQTGLTLGTISPRFYDGDGVSQSDPGVTLTELGDGDYRLSNLPVAWTITVDVSGTWHTAPPPAGRVERVMIPVRVIGQTISSLQIRAYRRSFPVTGLVLTSTPDGNDGDYWLTGLPTGAGDYLVVWEHGGSTYEHAWRGVAGGGGAVASTVAGEYRQHVWAHPELSDRGTVILATNESPTLPYSRLLLPRPTDIARAVPGQTSMHVAVHLPETNVWGEAETPEWNFVALLYNNGGAGGTIRVRAATSVSNYTSQVYSYDSGKFPAWPVASKYMKTWRRSWVHSWLHLPDEVRTEPVVGVELVDAAPRVPTEIQGDPFLQASRIYVSMAWQPPRHAARGYRFNFAEEKATVNELEGGGEIVRAGARRRVARLEVEDLGVEDLDDAWDLDTLRGTSGDVLLIWDPNDARHALKRTIAGRLLSVGEVANVGGGRYTKSYTLREFL